MIAFFATASAAPAADPTLLRIALGVAVALPVVGSGIWLFRVAEAEAHAAEARERRKRAARPAPAPERILVLEGGRSPGSAKLRERAAPSDAAPPEGP